MTDPLKYLKGYPKSSKTLSHNMLYLLSNNIRPFRLIIFNKIKRMSLANHEPIQTVVPFLQRPD